MFPWILSQLRPYTRPLLVLSSVSAAEIACRVASPWALKAVVDLVLGGGAPPAWLAALATTSPLRPLDRRLALLAVIVTLGLLVSVAHQAVLLLHTRLFARLGQRITHDVRARLFAHLQCLAMAHHAQMPAGDVVYRLSADAGFLEKLALSVCVPVVFSVLTLVTMFAVLVDISPVLAAVSLAVVPALYLVLRLHDRQVRGEAQRVKATESRVFQRAQESFSTIRLVKSFAREPYERARFAAASGEAMVARLGLARREARFSFAVGLLIALGHVAVLAVGATQVVEGRISAGTLLLVLAYLGFVYGPLTGIASSTSTVRDAVASAERVRDVLAVAAEPQEAAGQPPLPPLAGGVTFDGVTFAYEPLRPVLHGLSFAAPPGAFVALVGPSGGGKTTITSLLTRLYEPQIGRVLLDGRDARQHTLRSLREQVALVLQEAVLLSGTVRDNLRYGRLDATDEDIEAAARAANAHDFIVALPHGYDTELSAAGSGLSGGQRQRLSIARAFLKDAPILVLDEPTSALDTVSERHFVEALNRLRRGRTTFVIAHRLSTVRQADTILVIEGGCVVAAGGHHDLLRACPLYARLSGEFADAEGLRKAG